VTPRTSEYEAVPGRSACRSGPRGNVHGAVRRGSPPRADLAAYTRITLPPGRRPD
jgi:hypothetical protein